MKIRLFCTALLVLVLGVHAPVWAEETAGAPTPEQLAEEDKKTTAEEDQARRVSPLVVYDKRGGGATKPVDEKKEQTASRDTKSKGFSFSAPSNGGGTGGLSGGNGKPFGSSATAPAAPAAPPAGPGGPEKNHDGACERGGYRETAKSAGIPYAILKCQKQQLKDNKQLRNATGFALLPIVPAPLLKDQMDKLKK